MISKRSIAIFLKQLRDAIFLFITSLPRWAHKDFVWGLLIIPFVFMAVIYGVSEADIFGRHSHRACKHAMEVIHPSLLAITIGLLIIGYMKKKNAAFLFLAVLCSIALFRELGGQGTTALFVIGMIGLSIMGSAIVIMFHC